LRKLGKSTFRATKIIWHILIFLLEKNEKNRGFFRCPHDIQCINAKRVKRDIYEVGRKKIFKKPS